MLPKYLVNPAIAALSSLTFLIAFLLQEREKTTCYQALQSIPNCCMKQEVSYSFIILLILVVGHVTLFLASGSKHPPWERRYTLLVTNPILFFNSQGNCWGKKLMNAAIFPVLWECNRFFFNIYHSSLPSFIPHVLSGILLGFWVFFCFYDSLV